MIYFSIYMVGFIIAWVTGQVMLLGQEGSDHSSDILLSFLAALVWPFSLVGLMVDRLARWISRF